MRTKKKQVVELFKEFKGGRVSFKLVAWGQRRGFLKLLAALGIGTALQEQDL